MHKAQTPIVIYAAKIAKTGHKDMWVEPTLANTFSA
jgi:hypothetical protein